jgi:hypothetical protein
MLDCLCHENTTFTLQLLLFMMRNREGLPGYSPPHQNLTKSTGFVGMSNALRDLPFSRTSH